MKKIFYLVALFAAVMFTACDSSVQTPQGDKTKLWPAGKKGSNLWGFMDKKGNLEIAAKYDAVYRFSCGWAMVKEDGEYQFIDKSAKNKHSVDNEEKMDYRRLGCTDCDPRGLCCTLPVCRCSCRGTHQDAQGQHHRVDS